MNNDLISRKALLNSFTKEYEESTYPYFHINEIEDEIIKAPAVEAEPVKHGRWIVGGACNHVPHRIKNPEKWVTYKCSVCEYSNGRKQSNYCPNCGAKMDLEE